MGNAQLAMADVRREHRAQSLAEILKAVRASELVNASWVSRPQEQRKQVCSCSP